MPSRVSTVLFTVLSLFCAIPAHAKIVSQSATGFSLTFQADVPGDTQSAYGKFVSIASWWDASHSHSGDSKNLAMDVKNGGCWCETLPNGGFVRHMEIVHAAPAMTTVGFVVTGHIFRPLV